MKCYSPNPHNLLTFTICVLLFMGNLLPTQAQDIPLVHPTIGTQASSDDGSVKMTLIGKKQNFTGGSADTRDVYINSPKSVNIHPNGEKYYVNSLEGCTTISYDFKTNHRLKVISHLISAKQSDLWSSPSDFYPWTHYTPNNCFAGKPVESTFSHNGRYLWVPYYRRSFDINAQDPSAVAVIDTESDSIIRLMETGPLPKMIATSNDGQTVAISHWGNNTVGLIDISSDDPKEWKHKAVLIVDKILPLDYPLDKAVDRDNGSGYALRGTVFTPDDKYLLVGCMGGGGGIAVIDIPNHKYLGRVMGMMGNMRHLVISGDYLYLSINGAGAIQRIKLSDFMNVAKTINGKTATINGWKTVYVGKGARTICITPKGDYIFAACNIASAIYVVDARSMTVVCQIPVDSYPVGMDISSDGRYVFVTSQGRSSKDTPGVYYGGNAVNIYEVEYAVDQMADEKAVSSVPIDEDARTNTSSNGEEQGKSSFFSRFSELSPFEYASIGGATVLLCVLAALKTRKTRSNENKS